MNRRGGLGRGLAALIPPEPETAGLALREVELARIAPNPRQPREVFDESELSGLATSIRDVGVLQPIVVRPLADGEFELVAGERRLRACQLVGLETIPAVVRDTEDADLLKQALVENIHRVQLNPLEEAGAYQQLLDDFGFTQDELARRLGKSRPAISNALRLLSLPAAVARRVAAGVLSAGHAKALLALDDPRAQERLAERIVAEGASVRVAEEMVRLRLLDDQAGKRPDPGPGTADGRRARPAAPTAPGLVELQDDLSDALGTRVRIQMGARKGKVSIDFVTVDDLERLVGLIADGISATHAASDAGAGPRPMADESPEALPDLEEVANHEPGVSPRDPA